jgi:ABC-type spermidine/putrescine transport systems, ATPase components
MTLQLLRNKIEQEKGKKAQIEKNLADALLLLREKKRALHHHEQAREIIREVGLKTQQSLQFHISNITSLALESVFFDPYELKAEFVQRRNKTECDLYFLRDGNRIDPLSASGVGAVDVASFALRIASWSMERPRSLPVIVLDEPFRFLSADYQEQASLMVKEISQKLGIQFIIVTHEQILASNADRIFEVKIKKGISNVNQL